MVSTRIIETSVGAFVLAGFIALAFLALQVSGLNVHSPKGNTYTLYAHFTNAAGLTERAKVTVAGVVIGRVTAVQLNPKNNQAKVTLNIQQDVNYITQDSIASIQTAGVLGEKYLAISIGGADTLLTDGQEIQDTQSALVLEELIGKFLTSFSNKKD